MGAERLGLTVADIDSGTQQAGHDLRLRHPPRQASCRQAASSSRIVAARCSSAAIRVLLGTFLGLQRRGKSVDQAPHAVDADAEVLAVHHARDERQLDVGNQVLGRVT